MNDASYVASRFLSLSHQDDGAIVLHCARTGAIGVVPPTDADAARTALLPGTITNGPLTGILSDLEKGGFLVRQGTDEAAQVHEDYIARYVDPNLHLIVLPTEQCNFRCVYCYESFLRGTMGPELQSRLRTFVQHQPSLKHFSLSWFGGEPLVARDVVLENTRYFKQYCDESGVEFICAATTNAYLLTPEYADQVIPQMRRLRSDYWAEATAARASTPAATNLSVMPAG